MKGNRKHTMLIIELFVSFIAFFIILSLVFTSLHNARIPLGIEYEDVSEMNFHLPNVSWDTIKITMDQIYDYLKDYPGVESTGLLYSSTFFGKGYMRPHKSLVYKGKKISPDDIELMGAADDIQDILQIGMLEGRWFDSSDDALKNRPCIINQELKLKIFGEGKGLGEIVDFCDQQCVVTGICENFKHKGDYESPALLFIARHSETEGLAYEGDSFCMSGSNCMMYRLIKFGNSAPETIQEDLTRKIYSRFPGYSITFSSLKSKHTKYLRQTWIPLLSVFFVVLFLFVNVLLGLFGILWYKISLKKKEIGLRVAVGANKYHIYKQFIGEMFRVATLGIIPGVIVAVQFPILKVFKVETNIYLLAIFASLCIIYLLVTLCALLPSAQAAKIQPAVALHEE